MTGQIVIPEVQFPVGILPDWRRLWTPPERMSLSRWAEANLHLAPPSRVTGLVPLYGWQRPIFDSFTDPAVRKMTLMVSAQMTKTLFIQAAIAYVIVCEPAPILACQPNDDSAKQFMKENLQTMFAANPLVQSRLSTLKKRSDDNTLTFTRFAGGFLSVAGAQAPDNLRRRPVRYLFRDEVDAEGWDPDPVQGDKLEISEARVATYRSIAKIINTSTPTVISRPNSKRGRIHQQFLKSNQQELFVSCPACGEPQILEWSQVRVSRDVPSYQQHLTALYHCVRCDAAWPENDRIEAADKGEFRPMAEALEVGHVGFHLNHLASPVHRLSELAAKWPETLKDEGKRKQFFQIHLALPVEDVAGDTPDAEVLFARREAYPAGDLAIVPARARFLTAFADVQRDRIEYEVVAWARYRESWSMAYGVIRLQDAAGNVIPTSDRRVWDELKKVLQRDWDHENGKTMPIMVLGVDSGDQPRPVYEFVRRNPQIVVEAGAPIVRRQRTVVAVKGGSVDSPSPIQSVSLDANRSRGGVYLVTQGTYFLKTDIYAMLQAERPTGDVPTPGYCHFPDDREMQYFEGLCSERRFENAAGKIRFAKEVQRNEPLDCRVGAYLGWFLMRAHRWNDQQWEIVDRIFGEKQVSEPAQAESAPKTAQEPQKTAVSAPKTPVEALQQGPQRPRRRVIARFS